VRILLLNQTFFPDVASSGQHLTDLALGLAERGHQVTVVTSRRAYDDPRKLFQRRQTWRGIRICRIFNSGLGKQAKWRRAADFGTFMLSCCFRLALLPKSDVIVAMTSPPLISFIGAFYARFHGSRFCYWVMDLNPDEAIAAGWLSPGSLPARCLERLSRFSFHQASAVIALDRFMRERIASKGIAAGKIAVIPPWSHDSEIEFHPEGRARFRKAHGLEDKFVVMYSGNHSPCHPLDTVVAAAEKLAPRNDIAFCFVGGGTEFSHIKQLARERQLPNVLCLPYQPLGELAGSLSAADLHLVVMGDPFVGLVHPCKIYNILRIGTPLLYLGPEPSHISDTLQSFKGLLQFGRVAHGAVDQMVQRILKVKESGAWPDRKSTALLAEQYSKRTLLPQLVRLLELTDEKLPAPNDLKSLPCVRRT
jgi:putative colanic acid biosynthesis glycosyltransferase WcaI